ncbi:hypothetical protein PR048_011300 [Dryococelus australis]|uniref:Reverse transcriptase RNase H-like domain-containing protein n=1 Tax=Dryococelus australis TaxID=614101 RepID=A0ABQ9HL81_9NEOP|nr:hypothetical protein PR048_011300 [Dryococelus australis]
MKPPSTVSELQRFMGVVNYYGPFIENLSANTSNLRKLLQKDIVWFWTHVTKLITNCPVLTYFNPDDPITLSVHASKDALGAVLLQNNKPIAYASTTLTPTQCNYSQIEKELLGIAFDCTKFDHYLYSKVVNMETDHKPSFPLLKNLCLKLQRLIIKLQRYIINLRYVPGKYMYIADTLSRSAVSEDKSFTAMESEPLQSVVDYCRQGWPDKISLVKADVQPFYKYRHEITVKDNLVFKNLNVDIPKVMRSDILRNIHEGHIGIKRCQQRARGSVFCLALIMISES